MLSNVADNDVVKKSVFDKLVIKINTNLSRINTISIKVPCTNQQVSKTQFDSDKQNLKKRFRMVIGDQKIPHNSGIVKKTDLKQKSQKFKIKYLHYWFS